MTKLQNEREKDLWCAAFTAYLSGSGGPTINGRRASAAEIADQAVLKFRVRTQDQDKEQE